MTHTSGAGAAGHAPPAVIHIDLDGARHIYRTHGWAYKADDDPLFESGMRGALEVLAAAGVRATLFVITEDLAAPARRALIDAAVAAGHEVGSHTITHRRLTTLDRSGKHREIAGSRDQLEAAGFSVRGFRAPSFGIDRECLELADAEGYRYDSSVLRTATIPGLAAPAHRPSGPHRPFDDRRLLEWPVPVSDSWLPPFHPSYSLVLGEWLFRRGIRLAARDGAPLVLLFHLTDFADPLPAGLARGWRKQLFTLSYQDGARKRARCAAMLAFAAAHFRFTTTEDVLSRSLAS